MDTSVLILLITGILALAGFIFIITAALVSENNTPTATGTTGTTGTTGVFCSGPGTPALLAAPTFTRISQKSLATRPLSTQVPDLKFVQHTVQKLYRARSLKDPVSANHWVANALHGSDNLMCVYPYLCSIQDAGLAFSWPGAAHLSGTAGQDLSYDVDAGTLLVVSSAGETPMSCDVVDVDAMTATVIWQYLNQASGKTGSISCALVQGSPYMTFELNNVSMSFQTALASTLQTTSDPTIYTLTNYVIYLSSPLSVTASGDFVLIPSTTGVVRIAYYNTPEMLNILTQHCDVYALESTLAVSVDNTQPTWQITTEIMWTTASVNTPANPDLLMIALPHHNIINTTYTSANMTNPLISPYHYVTTTDNNWLLGSTLPKIDFTYAPVSTGTTALNTVWTTELENVISNPPTETVNKFKWLGSLGYLALIGTSLGNDITAIIDLLKPELTDLLRILVYDKTWNGIISDVGLTNCVGDSDGGNAFYNQHIAQYGYVVLAYAVVGYHDAAFLNKNVEIVSWYARNIMNYYEFDTSFPLWRNKHWYFGYSVASGLEPEQARGKNATNIAESLAGYFGCYLLSLLLPNLEFFDWSLAMLASELESLQTYFQVANSAVVTDPAFIQATVTMRGDAYYRYFVNAGNTTYPERNASMMVPMLKPLNLLSPTYIKPEWLNVVRGFMVPAVTQNIQPESLAYAEAILANDVDTIVDNSAILLPYGSLWSAVLYSMLI